MKLALLLAIGMIGSGTELWAQAPKPASAKEATPAEKSVRALWRSLVEATKGTTPADEAKSQEAAKKLLAGLQQHAEVAINPALEAYVGQPVQWPAAANAWTLNQLARKLVDEERRHFATALLLAERAHELAPQSAHMLDTVAWAQLRCGKHDAAIATFKGCIGKGQDDAVEYAGLALVYALKGEVKAGWEALDSFSKGGFPDEHSKEAFEKLSSLPADSTDAHKKAVVAWHKKWQEAKPLASATNDAGDELRILGYRPELPARLEPGQKLLVRIQYKLESADWCHIWARPGITATNWAFEPSYRIAKGSGEITRFVLGKGSGRLPKVHVSMGSGARTLLEVKMDIDAEWGTSGAKAQPL